MDDAEQERIEKELRARLAKPRYPAIFTLPVSHVIAVKGPFPTAEKGQPRCQEIARAEIVVEGRPGLVDRHQVQCELPQGHDGPHSLAATRLHWSKQWRARQWPTVLRDRFD